MKYPVINQQSNITVKVPALSGGLNMRDTLSEIADNQFSNMKNMWWENGALRTRPGMRDTGGTFETVYEQRQWISDRETLLVHRELTEDGAVMVRAALLSQSEGFIKLGKNGMGYRTVPFSNGKLPTVFGCRSIKGGDEDVEEQSDFVLFLSNGEVIVENKAADEPEDGDGWIPAQPYVPTVMVYGSSEYTIGNGGSGGKAYEALNMLTGAFKCTFAPDGNGEIYPLPYKKLTYNAGEIVTVSFQLVNKVTFEVDEYTLQIDPADISKKSDGTRYAGANVAIKPQHVDGVAPDNVQNPTAAAFIFYDSGKLDLHITYTDLSVSATSPTAHPFPQSDLDHITVTAWKTKTSRQKKICRMKQGAWFGNTQLFLCGNPSEKNMVCWSAVRDPLYFPENNYAYVGDYAQAVTAMRQQGDTLVIFQEHSIQAMRFAMADSDAYEYAMEAGVDAVSVGTQLSVVPLHSAVGCDCPGSIRLCNNRLVWATSSGKVYMLPNVNAYNERNVREVSRNIERLLETRSASMLKRSVAGEFKGYYVLLVGYHVYLLDTQAGTFSNLNYYSKDDESQKLLSWYLWYLPERADGYGMMANDKVMLLHTEEDGVGKVYALDGEDDVGTPIQCSFTTKQFDFDRPDKLKAVMQMYITVGDQEGNTVRVGYITEAGEYGDAFFLEQNGDYSEREAGHMRTFRVTPNINRVRTFGFRCQSDGAMAIGGIMLKFKEQGVLR